MHANISGDNWRFEGVYHGRVTVDAPFDFLETLIKVKESGLLIIKNVQPSRLNSIDFTNLISIKCNSASKKTVYNIYFLLAECEAGTASYRPCFFFFLFMVQA